MFAAQRRISGLLMFELQAVRAEMGRRKAENGVLSSKELEETFLVSLWHFDKQKSCRTVFL